MAVEAVVDQVRPAGLIVRLVNSDITGFVPGSHINTVRTPFYTAGFWAINLVTVPALCNLSVLHTSSIHLNT